MTLLHTPLARINITYIFGNDKIIQKIHKKLEWKSHIEQQQKKH